jgi:hypothetical protein
MPSPAAPTGLAPSPRERVRRHLGTGAGPLDGNTGRTGRLELVLTVSTIVAMSTVLQGPAVWLVAALVLAGTIVGTLQILGAVEGPDADRGVPVETLLLPAVAALGSVGAIRLIPLGLGIVPALVGVAVLVDRCVAVEQRIAGAAQGPTADDRSRALAAMLVVALVAFIGIAAIIPNGLAGVGPDGAPPPPLPIGDLVLLALADALVAGLLGYRAAALRMTRARDALWAALTSAVAIAIGAAALRAMGIPRLIGPALLMLLFYLWDSLHAAPPARRRDPRWIWETLVLAGLGAAILFWNLRLVG